jgi:hypothetical protein
MEKELSKIEYKEKIVPDAYHGTSLNNALNIIKEKRFQYKRDGNLYLGDGVYFYEASIWHAVEWCRRCHKDKDYGIICATINLGKCLDLANYEYRALLTKIALKLKFKGFDEITDSFVINFIATVIDPFDTVRHSHIVEEEGYGKIFHGSRIPEFYQLIICVRNQDRILNLNIIKEGKTNG